MGKPVDRAVWTRVESVQEGSLDLMAARFVRHRFAPHAHEEYAIGVCTDGVETLRYRGETHISGPGTVVLIEPGETHTGGPAHFDGFAYRVLYPAVALMGRAHFEGPLIEDPGLAAELRHVHVMLSRGDDRLEAESRLLLALGDLVERHAVEGAVRAVPAAGLAHSVMTRLGDQLVRPPGLAEIAADLGLSRYQLLRAFRDATGMPPYAWLAQHRVSLARGLLDTGLRPAEVAARVGFADQAHLTRWFRRVLGVTPGAYRNSVQDSLPRHT